MRALAIVPGLLACVACSSAVVDPEPPASAVPAVGGSGASSRLAVDRDALYWFDGSVRRQLRGSEEAEVLSTTQDGGLMQVAVNSTHVVHGNSFIRRTPIEGGRAEALADTMAGTAGFAADDASLYYPKEGALTARSLTDGTEEPLDSGGPALGLAIGGDELFGTSCSFEGAAAGSGGIWRVARSGGGQHTRVALTFCPIPIVLDDAYAYIVDRLENDDRTRVLRVPRSGGDAETVVACDQFSVAVKDGFVYTIAAGQVIRAPALGGTVEVLADAPEAEAVAVDEDRVYWLAPAGDAAGYALKQAQLPP